MATWSQKALFEGRGSPGRGSSALFSTETVWFLQLRDQIFVLDSAASLRQWEIFFFFSEANKSLCLILIQPNSSHAAYALYISYFGKSIPGTGSGQWTRFYFPLNWDTLKIRKAASSVTEKQQHALQLWKITTWGRRVRGEWRTDFRCQGSSELLQSSVWLPPPLLPPPPAAASFSSDSPAYTPGMFIETELGFHFLYSNITSTWTNDLCLMLMGLCEAAIRMPAPECVLRDYPTWIYFISWIEKYIIDDQSSKGDAR